MLTLVIPTFRRTRLVITYFTLVCVIITGSAWLASQYQGYALLHLAPRLVRIVLLSQALAAEVLLLLVGLQYVPQLVTRTPYILRQPLRYLFLFGVLVTLIGLSSSLVYQFLL